MQAEALELVRKMWKSISGKRSALGWFLAIISALFYLSDKWDSLNSLFEKLKKMSALSKFVVDAAHSPLVQLSILVLGFVWIGGAALFSVKASEKRVALSATPEGKIVLKNIPIECGPDVKGSVVKANGFTFYRARIEPEGKEQFPALIAKLHGIKRDGVQMPLDEVLQIKFYPGDGSAPCARKDDPAFLDVVFVRPNRSADLHVLFWPPGMTGWNFESGHDYLLDIAVLSKEISRRCEFEFIWTGDANTSSCRLISDSKQVLEARSRTINFDQEAAIIKLFGGVELHPIWITTKAGARENDKEAHDYSMQLIRTFSKAGVPIEGRASVDLGTLFPLGVSLFWKKTIYNEVTASSIIEAVKITGVECKEVDRQVCPSHLDNEPEINLMIGSNELKPLS
jgi:hypothetical protein